MNRFRTVELYRDDMRRLVAIESIDVHQSRFNTSSHVYAALVPLAVIVCTPNGNQVLSVEVDNAKLNKLRQRHPELDTLITLACSDDSKTMVSG